MSIDLALCIISVWAALVLRTESFQLSLGQIMVPSLASATLLYPLMLLFGVYNEITRYSGTAILVSFAKVFAVYVSGYVLLVTFITIEGVPRSLGLLQPILLGGLVINARFFVRGLANYLTQGNQANEKNVIIYGASDIGRQIANAVKQLPEINLVGFFDKNPELLNKKINGIKVLDPGALVEASTELNVHEILLATKVLTWQEKSDLISSAAIAKVPVRYAPSVNALLDGSFAVDQIKKLQIEDLLGRDPVKPDQSALTHNVDGKVVLISGAGGSIGSELTLQLIKLRPKRLILMDHSEFALYSIVKKVKQYGFEGSMEMVPILASVCHKEKVESTISEYQPDTIFHAAAYKHVDIVENNPFSGYETNFLGTKHMADAAARSDVGVFILISSDKAVRPTNVMGATKRLAELYLQSLKSSKTKTKFVVVRFGNVLGSSGSVVPLFKSQIQNNGPVTVTHPEIQRFFMTITEAVELVIQAGVIAGHGEILLLDMGEPVKIAALASEMIRLSGRTIKNQQNADGDIEIVYIGLRPGEKLYEELLVDGSTLATHHPRIFRANETDQSLKNFKTYYRTLKSLDHKSEPNQILAALVQVLPEYTPFQKR